MPRTDDAVKGLAEASTCWTRARLPARLAPAIVLAALLAASTAIADPQLAAPPPPIDAPSDQGSDMQGNAPSVGTDDLARLKAEMARQKAAQQQARRERQKLQEQSAKLQADSIALAARVQEKELAVSLSEDNLDVLNQRETQVLAKLKLGRAQLTDTLAALELLQRQRPPALAVSPGDAADAVRSAILLSDVVPRLTAQASDLAKQLQSLRLLRERAAAEHKTLAAAAQALRNDQAQLGSVISQRTVRRDELGETDLAQSQRLAELGRRAQSLSALVEGLHQPQINQTATGDAIAPPAPQGGTTRDGVWASAGSAAMSFAEAKGHVRMPVVGKVVEKFGVPNGGGGATKGIKIATRLGAQVVAPFDGRVKYAGPLKTYGNVLIVEADGDYLIILAGMAHVDATVGQWLLAGEPVGRMADAGEDGPHELYLEFRQSRVPFDPLPWLAGVMKEG